MKNLNYLKMLEKELEISSAWDAKAASQRNIHAFVNTYLNPEPARYQPDGSYSLAYCLAAAGESINDQLRSGIITPRVQEIIKMFDDNYKAKCDLILYRGVSQFVYDQMVDNATDMPGVDLLEKGFLQTSLIKGRELPAQIHLRIFCPAATKAIFLGDVNYEGHFSEVDVMKGAQLKLISADDAYINVKLITTD